MDFVILLISGIISRFIPHVPNATAVGASAILAGKHLSFKDGLIVVLGTMLITDAVFGFHQVMWAVYLSLLCSVILGKVIGKHGIIGLGASGIFSSTVFYILTNAAVWLSASSMYTKNVEGFIACMTAGIPFYRNMIIGDAVYLIILSAALKFAHSVVGGKLLHPYPGRSAKI